MYLLKALPVSADCEWAKEKTQRDNPTVNLKNLFNNTSLSTGNTVSEFSNIELPFWQIGANSVNIF